jgi:hypothetical protein
VEVLTPSKMERETAHRTRARNIEAPATQDSHAPPLEESEREGLRERKSMDEDDMPGSTVTLTVSRLG